MGEITIRQPQLYTCVMCLRVEFAMLKRMRLVYGTLKQGVSKQYEVSR